MYVLVYSNYKATANFFSSSNNMSQSSSNIKFSTIIFTWKWHFCRFLSVYCSKIDEIMNHSMLYYTRFLAIIRNLISTVSNFAWQSKCTGSITSEFITMITLPTHEMNLNVYFVKISFIRYFVWIVSALKQCNFHYGHEHCETSIT